MTQLHSVKEADDLRLGVLFDPETTTYLLRMAKDDGRSPQVIVTEMLKRTYKYTYEIPEESW